MLDSYEIVLYVFKDGVTSTKTPAYSLKETAQECSRLLNEYDGIEGENIKLSVRDRVRECVILTLDIHDLKAVKQANEFVDVKRFVTDALNKYDLNKCTEFETIRGCF